MSQPPPLHKYSLVNIKHFSLSNSNSSNIKAKRVNKIKEECSVEAQIYKRQLNYLLIRKLKVKVPRPNKIRLVT
jgi:hypothetical protein